MPDYISPPPDSGDITGTTPGRPLHLEVLLLIALVAGIYFTRLPALPCSLDEPQWAAISLEMIWSGDWTVPRQYSYASPDRPPAHEWLIAGSILALGTGDMTAPRLPSALATLFTALLVYGFTRTILSRRGALAAGAAYATMWEIMAKGSTADSEAVFTLFVSASLLFWIMGFTRKWPPVAAWAAGYFFAALAVLTKGPQGLYFFIAPVLVFLCLRRDWRFLFSRFHAAGLALFAAVVGAWLVPFWLKTDSQAVKQVFTGLIGQRFGDAGILAEIKHLAAYPFDVLAMMMPWSLLLALYARRDFRRSLAGSHGAIPFLCITLAVSFVPMWIPPGSHGRYLMPVFPCIAPFIGIALDRLARPFPDPQMNWINGALRSITGLSILAVGGVILVASWVKPDSYLAQPKSFAAFYFLAAAAITLMLFRARVNPGGRCARFSVLVVAAFIGLCFTGMRTNQYVRYKVDIKSAIDTAKSQMPPDVRLVSLGYLHPVFEYYFGRPIAAMPWPTSITDVPPDMDFFCFSSGLTPDTKLPFAWTEIAEVRCDRGSLTPSSRSVIIGRRLPDISLRLPSQAGQIAVPLP